MAGTVQTMTLTGSSQTLRILTALPDRLQKRAVTPAVRAGGAPFVSAAKRNAPRATGLFKRSLTQKVVSYRGGAVVISIVGQLKSGKLRSTKKIAKSSGGISGRGEIVPVHFVENDIQPHAVTARRDSYVTSGRRGGRRRVYVGKIQGNLRIAMPPITLIYRRRIQHPGVRGRQPIRRAYDSSNGEAARRFEDRLTTEVLKVAPQAGVSV